MKRSTVTSMTYDCFDDMRLEGAVKAGGIDLSVCGCKAPLQKLV